jgi:hypothetical protein
MNDEILLASIATEPFKLFSFTFEDMATGNLMAVLNGKYRKLKITVFGMPIRYPIFINSFHTADLRKQGDSNHPAAISRM